MRSMFLSLHQSTLDIFATEKRFNHGGAYGLKIPANLHFYGPEKAVKLPKNNIKIEENINETVKHSLKKIYAIFHKKCPL